MKDYHNAEEVQERAYRNEGNLPTCASVIESLRAKIAEMEVHIKEVEEYSNKVDARRRDQDRELRDLRQSLEAAEARLALAAKAVEAAEKVERILDVIGLYPIEKTKVEQFRAAVAAYKEEKP